MEFRGGVRALAGLAALGVVAVLGSRTARGEDEEPGAAAVAAARQALEKVQAAAAAPTSHTAALGDVLTRFAKPGEPAAPVRGQALDSAAQPFLAEIEPRLVELRERILDRRHRFLTGEDRPPEAAKKADFETAVFDVRSIVGTWHDDEIGPARHEQTLSPTTTDPAIKERPLGFDIDKLRDLVDRELGRGDSRCDASGGSLLVRATAEDLARVQDLVDRLRAETGRRVQLEVGAYKMTRDVRLAHQAARTDAEAERVLEQAVATGQAVLLAARTSVVGDGGVAQLAPQGSRTFLAEAQVNQTGPTPVLQPVTKKIELGLKGQVRATIATGRKDAIVDLDLAYRELKGIKRETISDHDIELPESLVTRCSTTLTIPLGGSALVGGTFAGSEEAATACVFLVRASRFVERAKPAPRATGTPAPAPDTHRSNEPLRPEVQDLDALLARVVEAIARVQAARRFELHTFDVRDLLEGTHVRWSPPLGILVPPRPQRGGGMTGGVLTFGSGSDDRWEGPLGLEPEKLEVLLRTATGAEAAWCEPASYELHRAEVVVFQTPGTIAKVDKLLEELRKDRSGNVEVEVDWCRVDDAFLAELAKGTTALSPEAVARLDSAVATGERAVRTAAGFVVVQRGDTGAVHGGAETTFIADFEHASGGTATVVEKVSVPLPRVVRQGFAFDALGRGDPQGGEGSLALAARLGLLRVTEMPAVHTPGGPVVTPALDDAETSFDGVAPRGALVLVVGRVPGEKRPAVVAVLRSRFTTR